MEWARAIDAYCERTGPEYWSEPINALTNAAFVLSACILWRRSGGVALARILCGILVMIGLGSFLFHTHAQAWAALADTVPILGFILVYIFALNRLAFDLPAGKAAALALLFIPYAAGVSRLAGQIDGLGGTAAYVPVPLLIGGYAWALRHAMPDLARGLAAGAGLLVVSLTFRTLDAPLCGRWTLGTHFVWHLLNATLLGWMIEVYRRARLGNARAGR